MLTSRFIWYHKKMRFFLCILIIAFFFNANTSDDIKIKNVCEWYHEKIIGWHQNHLLFRKRHLQVSDKSKYPDTDEKTIQRYLLKQKKLKEAIVSAEKNLQNLSKIYHYLECTRFEKAFEKN